MNRLWLVARHEYRRHVLKRSFLLAILSVPLLIVVVALLSALPTLLGGASATSTSVGHVDQAGVLAGHAPASTGSADQAVRWIPFPTLEAAEAALQAEQIAASFVLAADYPTTRQVGLVYVEEPDGEVVRQFRELVQVHLLADQPPEIVRRAVEGSHLSVRLPDSPRELSGSLSLGQLFPALTGLALIALIFFSSGYLMQAVVEEKENRTIEILVTSISPGQLMTGKVLGISAVTATQFACWILFAMLAVFVGGQFLGVEWLQDLSLDPQAILMMLALVIPAFVMVAALMVAMGAMLTDEQAGQQIALVFISLYMIPLFLAIPLMRAPNSALAVALSIFPLTAPVVLPLRTLFIQVPFWQFAAAVTIQSLLALGALWLVARTLRLGMLRYGKRLHWRELLGMAVPQARALPSRDDHAAGTQADEHTARSANRRTTKTLLVLRHELVTALTKPWFALMCIGLPLLIFLQLAALDAMGSGGLFRAGPGAASESGTARLAPASEIQGYVDQRGLIQSIPGNIPEGMLVPFGDEASAHDALDAGEIDAYYVIPAGYVETGELLAVRTEYSPLSPTTGSETIDWVLLVNLLGGDVELAALVWNPVELQATAWTPASEITSAEESSSQTRTQESLARLIPTLVMLLLYGVIVLASSLLLGSISEEKKGRVMEVLLLSVSPLQMLSGKIAALGLAGLFQAAAWGIMGYLFYLLAGRTLDMPDGLDLSTSVLVWGAVFFLLGYALYASLTAGAGALVPDLKQARPVSLMIYAPALVGFYIGLMTVESPHGALPTAASLFPLTAPFTMMSRLVAGGVPTWQLFLSAGLLVVTNVFVVRAVARMFQAQNLLSGQPASPRHYLRALLGKA